jgi:hypothetical protein
MKTIRKCVGFYLLAAASMTISMAQVVAPQPAPISPSIKGPLLDGDSVISGNAQKPAATYPTVAIYICITDGAPASPLKACINQASQQSASLTNPAAPTVPINSATVTVPTNPTEAKADYVLVNTDGSFSAKLANPLKTGQHVYVTQIATDSAKTQLTNLSSVISVGTQCNTDPLKNPYSDCDLNLSLIAGVEQSAQSSLSSEITPFVRIFARANPFKHSGSSKPADPSKPAKPSDSKASNLYLWGTIRFLGAPTTSSTQGVVSVVSDPSGNLSTQTFSTIGTSLDVLVGGEYVLTQKAKYSVSLIAGGGGTTPLQANTLALAFQAPPFGTIECAQLVPSIPSNRFTTQFQNYNILPGSASNTTGSTPTCLVNGNNPTTTNGTTTYGPINTLAFSNQDRSNFFGKYEFGFRLIDRYHAPGTSACGDTDTANHIGPCERGIVDGTIGQDSGITGGQFRHLVFKMDAVYPLSVPSVQFLYLFGSIDFRLTSNTTLAPLILQSAPLTALTGTGTTAVPNAQTAVLSLVQPDRDFYRFGVGVNLNQLFTKLFTAKTSTTSSTN